MNSINNRFLVFALLLLVVFFLYFGSGLFLGGGMIGRQNENGWMGINGWLWFLTLVTVIFGVSLSWLHFKKKV
jgi:preprotein translocase subunit SecG